MDEKFLVERRSAEQILLPKIEAHRSGRGSCGDCFFRMAGGRVRSILEKNLGEKITIITIKLKTERAKKTYRCVAPLFFDVGGKRTVKDAAFRKYLCSYESHRIICLCWRASTIKLKLKR